MHVTEPQRRKIEDLHTRYIRLIDDDRLEEWPELFTDYCLYRITSRDGQVAMECRGMGMLQDRVTHLRDAGADRYSHQISGLWIESFDGETAVCRSNYLVTRNGVELFSAGVYLDRILLDGTAKFEERIVVADAPLLDTLLMIPL